MKDYIKQPENETQTVHNQPQAAKQGSLQDVIDSLETYTNIDKQEHPQTESRNKTGLPDALKTGVENLSGYSMDDVKVHYNSDKPARIEALAYTQGTDIHVAPGQEKYLPHEAWHVVQQKQGRVQPTIQLQGIHVNDNEGLEEEADRMGEQSLQVKQKNKVFPINLVSNFQTIQMGKNKENNNKKKDNKKVNPPPNKKSNKKVEKTQNSNKEAQNKKKGNDYVNNFSKDFEEFEKYINIKRVIGHINLIRGVCTASDEKVREFGEDENRKTYKEWLEKFRILMPSFISFVEQHNQDKTEIETAVNNLSNHMDHFEKSVTDSRVRDAIKKESSGKPKPIKNIRKKIEDKNQNGINSYIDKLRGIDVLPVIDYYLKEIVTSFKSDLSRYVKDDIVTNPQTETQIETSKEAQTQTSNNCLIIAIAQAVGINVEEEDFINIRQELNKQMDEELDADLNVLTVILNRINVSDTTPIQIIAEDGPRIIIGQTLLLPNENHFDYSRALDDPNLITIRHVSGNPGHFWFEKNSEQKK